jgi:ATP-dependent DNA helicase RecQ
VEEFAGKLSRALEIPLSNNLVKIRSTQPQKTFEPVVLKRNNVKDAFDYNKPKEVKGKSILLFDDICDSGATLKEIGRLLTELGADKITPLVIAKTVGGDLDDN